ncbi:MAG: GIY-YIG nuclease family protein [Eubacteriaceae bacterium]|nr:GIY-YIG nuclease family protein [Eubacteriaceae bacterium]
MDNKKELIAAYKNREQIGGIFAIKNNRTGKWYVDKTPDIASAKNRFGFMGSSFMKIANDFKAQKGEGFIFETLEELKKADGQTAKEFSDDLAILHSLWIEKLDGQDLY